MPSGSLVKAITTSIANPTLPLPDDLVTIIHEYLEKHSSHDDTDSQRLQDELLSIFQTSILDKSARLAPFLAILRMLKPAIRGKGRLLQWWDKLAPHVLAKLGQEKNLAVEARETVLGILVFDEDEAIVVEDAKTTSQTVTRNLLEIWLQKLKCANEQLDDHAKFIEGQLRTILISFGKKRPKDFLSTANKYFVDKNSRISVLSLLCDFVRHQPPHLDQILQTPLFRNLLRCLQADTSTRVISMAMTFLIMCLPHIPTSMSKHLPALFNIYSRMLFWDRERKRAQPKENEHDKEKDGLLPGIDEKEEPWDELYYLLESEDETVPELLHYFTFLYGLYPINFMSYIRKPQRYLRHASFPGADDLDVEPMEIRQRSEPFRQVHLLHPNFFTMTIESEITDGQRWMTSEASDVVAECMGLYSPANQEAHILRSNTITRRVEPNSDVPEQPLLQGDDTQTPSQHNTWRNTQSTAVGSSDGFRTSSLHRKLSQTSQSMPSILDSPSIHPSDRNDSPTLPPQTLSSPSHNQLQDLLNGQKPSRTSIYQALTNDSVASLALSNNHDSSSIRMDAYLTSLTRDTIPRSPSIRATNPNVDPNLKVAYLQREIELLRNDLNFERYLKQQHLSHIGQLRTKQIREARIEAETQNLINSNKNLKSKLEEAKRLATQMRSENEKSKTHSRKWESDLSAKLKNLREEQKKWNVERDELKSSLERAKERTENLKQIVLSMETKELSALQKVQSVETSLDELEHLRDQVQKLTLSLRTYEAKEPELEQAKENEEAALRKVTLLELELRSRDQALADAKSAFDKEIEAAQRKDEDAEAWEKKKQGITQQMLDTALANSRTRVHELQKAHSHLLKQYTALHSTYQALKEARDNGEDLDEPLLNAGSTSFPAGPSSPKSNGNLKSGLYDYDPELGLTRIDTAIKSYARNSDARSPASGHHFQSPQPFSPQTPVSAGHAGLSDGESHTSADTHDGKSKIKPHSEVRIYGRGGVQNIGKTPKDKKEKEKGKEAASKENTDPKKEKKSVGIRGIRGFGGM